MPFFHGTVDHAEKVAERTLARAETSVTSILSKLFNDVDSFFLPKTSAQIEKLIKSTLGEVDNTAQQRMQDVDVLAKSLMAELDGKLKGLILLLAQLVFGFFVVAVAVWFVLRRGSGPRKLGGWPQYGLLMMLVGSLTAWMKTITDSWFFTTAGMGLVGFLWALDELEREARRVALAAGGVPKESNPLASPEKTIKRIHVERTEIR